MSASARFWRAATIVPAIVPLVLISAGIGLAAVSTPQASPEPALRTVSWKDGSPIGYLGDTSIVPGGLRVTGWDFDPNAVGTPLYTAARVDGRWIGSHVFADKPRPAVAAAYPRPGANHGFDWTVRVPEGRHQVCVGARNIGRGTNPLLGCRTFNFDYGPVGQVGEIWSVGGGLRVVGWAVDNDAPTQPVQVTTSIDGVAHVLTADGRRSDVAATHPGAGPSHGFDETYPVSQGAHRVCVSATNIGYGTDNSLGCFDKTVDDSPLGELDTIHAASGGLQVQGWAFDPDARTSATRIAVSVDGRTPTVVTANIHRKDVAESHPLAGAAHGFDLHLSPGEGTHRVCATALNVSYGSDRTFPCQTFDLDFTPAAAVTALAAGATGATVQGWAEDPDTSSPITAQLSIDGEVATTVSADRNGASGSRYRGRQYSAFLPMTSGTHQVCVVAVNVKYGTHNSAPACRSITLALSPLASWTSLTRAPGSNNLVVKGWAFDPDSMGPATLSASVDGQPAGPLVANATNPAPAATYPRFGSQHGLSATLAADEGEHTVCLMVRNVSGGKDLVLGCRSIIAVHPTVPGTPNSVTAVGGFGGATVSWSAPTSDGGAPVSGYTVYAWPGGHSVTVGPTTRSAIVSGLRSSTAYTFVARASNQVGISAGSVAAAARTTAGPPAQRTPAPVSTSRYIRNAVNASSSELATMRAEGAHDAKYSPSGHGYMVLLDIGGQDQYDHGVVLSAGVRFVTYSTLVKDINAYIDGYHSAQHSSAPVVIALGTNNDIDVNSTSGAVWADSLVDPVRSHASRYLDITVAGANDIEPGFRGSYSQTKAWLGGYLGATAAPFVFNGSADGCSYSYTSSSCNNGWTMSGLQYLAGGASPTRILNLPQIYNTAMAGQWKYISLTGIVHDHPRINFAGPLTEYTACQQAGGCGSMTGHTAWNELWGELQSDSRLKVASLPYSTDLRIDR